MVIEDRLVHAGIDNAINVGLLCEYVDLLTKWNRKINLTSLEIDPITPSAVDRLIIEPVLASRFVESDDVSVVDLGSGGGSPAIPLKTQLPRARFRLIESRSRKCAFLREAVRNLGLTETFVEEKRFELLANSQHLSASADIVTIRAVRIDDDLCHLMGWLLAPAGLIFRFSSSTESRLPSRLKLMASHPLIDSLKSELQIIQILD
jgi:16S rRNA (guanine527-N7)-methyltransferase